MEPKRYPTDLSDAEWALVAPHIPPAWRGGRPRTVDARELVNAMRSVARTGVPWRALPKDLPHFRTVYYHYRQWIRLGVWDQILDALRAQDRVRAGRKPEPTAMVIDSQTVKVGSRAGERGYDGGKQLTGRKRLIGVDTDGRLLRSCVLPADVRDQEALHWWFGEVLAAVPTLRHGWADAGFRGDLTRQLEAAYDVTIAIVTKREGHVGFVVQPRRWTVERTFAWFGRFRRLARDDEVRPDCSEAMLTIAASYSLLRRLTRTASTIQATS